MSNQHNIHLGYTVTIEEAWFNVYRQPEKAQAEE